MPSEAKQTEMMEFETKNNLLQGHAKRQAAHALKNPWVPGRVSAKHF